MKNGVKNIQATSRHISIELILDNSLRVLVHSEKLLSGLFLPWRTLIWQFFSVITFARVEKYHSKGIDPKMLTRS